MSRGKQGFTFVAALATVATMAVAPAFAVTTSGSVAATDERAPGPVANVVAFPGADGVEVTWDLSLSDFVRQSPTGSDFTSGGTFANVNDVAGYNVYRGEGALDPVLVGTVKPGETSFVDALPALRRSLQEGEEPYPDTADGHPTEIGYTRIAGVAAGALAGRWESPGL